MTESPKRPGWKQVLRNLGQPKVAVMLLLGFSSGLPFMLVGNTMGYWLRDVGIELATIGFASWVGLAYSFKFLWAPVIDKVDAPLLGRWLGRRRGWMALAQLAVGIALLGMAVVRPEGGLGAFVGLALVAAFASATQDIVVDAWRIESSEKGEELALLSSGYQLGYRAALLVTDALILILAARLGWAPSYLLMAGAMGLGLLATFWAREPLRHAPTAATGSLLTGRGLFDAILGPFIAFFRDHGRWALLMLLAISLYRLPDFFMGPMANPFYSDLGIDKEVVGTVRGTIGLVASVVGIAAAGLFALRFGYVATLLAGAVLGPGSNIAFAWLAYQGPDPSAFATAMVIDNFATGFAGTALVAYMSSLTNVGYTATQYALLSSFYALPGKFIKGFSGATVEALSAGTTLLDGYARFFIVTALFGIPVLLLCLALVRRARPPAMPPPA
ncbi:MFS transporter [Lysobacter sp. N42]|uniref:AmpG family muropeptide MFS transporter n=1 Tax=Lysobacter sp. N42 TaxID=2545719 RepID=UPI00104A57D6|nr:MFS transporter [Lysobacter sp. N42]TCZ79626.1 MFS transporter [Lysobacter sp. N42]